MISVRRITDPSDGDIDAIVEVVVAAFRDDVGMASGSANSPRLQADIHRRTIQGCIAHGQVHVGVVNGRIQGVVAATAPGADWHYYQQEDFMRSLSPYLSEWYSYHYIPTYEELYRAAFRSGERARKEAWHVKLLAVHPDAQRVGLGRLMLSAICTQADSNGKRIVTDVKSPYHVRWFRKSGFSHRSVKNFTAKDSAGFPLWCMAREPSPPE
ncbi:acyl-CoA N-acyltransferase [Ganoderma leucocontextum]|nr:acyl-CoA N-acyltransferase [Ganoderma leucocontextum]